MNKAIFTILLVAMHLVVYSQRYSARIYSKPFDLYTFLDVRPSTIINNNLRSLDSYNVSAIMEKLKTIKNEMPVDSLYQVDIRVLIDIYKENQLIDRLALDRSGRYEYQGKVYHKDCDLIKIVQVLANQNWWTDKYSDICP